MQKRTFDETMQFVNSTIADMKIDRKDKIVILGLVTALGLAHEATKQKTGKKIVKSNGMMGYWACDQCEEPLHPDDHYCPNCGARMEGGQDG